MAVRLTFELVFAAGVAAAFVGALAIVMAGLSRPWLGRAPSDDPLRQVVSRNPYEAVFLFYWRQRRWASLSLGLGALVAVITGLAMLAIWGE